MPQLNQLEKNERTETCRAIARAAHDCLAKAHDGGGCVIGGPFQARVYKACSELGIIEEVEFAGNSFSPERVAVLEGFERVYAEASDLGVTYTQLLEPLHVAAPTFALSAEALVRMWCVARFSATLHEEGPFADLRVCLTLCDDEDGSADENDENDKSESDDEGDDDDSIIASSSDEESAEESAEESDEESVGDADDADLADQGERKGKRARVEEEEDDEDDDDEARALAATY